MKRVIFAVVVVFACSIQAKSQGEKISTTLDSIINAVISEINQDSLVKYTKTLEDFGTRFAIAPNHREVAVWIQDKFKSFGYTDVVLDSFNVVVNWPFSSGTSYDTWQYNVVANVQGTQYPDSIYVMGAHYDAILYPNGDPFDTAFGADDNASGVAAALEVARVFKLHNIHTQRTIRWIAFPIEEFGLHGSYDYASKANSDLLSINMMINSDMIGYCTASPSTWKVTFQKYDNSQSVTSLANQICNNYTTLTAEEKTTNLHSSDSYSFYQFGYKTIFLQENTFSPDYHQVTDITANLNKNYLAEVTKISCGMLLHETGPSVSILENVKASTCKLFANFPNPFREETTIKYQLADRANVSIKIYNSSHQEVANLVNEKQEPGVYYVRYNAHLLTGGLYYCVMKSDQYTATQKMILIK